MTQLNDNQTSHGATSRSLLERVRARDDDAWSQLTELYGPLVYHWCRKLGVKPDDSSDILQNVFRSLVIHIDRFEHAQTPGSFRAWLWTIVRNKVRDHFKTQADKAIACGGSDAQFRMLNVPDHHPDDSADSSVSAAGSLTYRAMNIARREVKRTTWQAFWRSTIDDISPAAVAEEMGISVESVWQARSRILKRLRALLDE